MRDSVGAGERERESVCLSLRVCVRILTTHRNIVLLRFVCTKEKKIR